MSDEKNNPLGGFGGTRIIIYVLVAVLAISALFMRNDPPEWEKCKESLIQQFFSDQCTPRSGFGQEIVIPQSLGQNT